MSNDGLPFPGPGWYPDPSGHAAYRWWSGTAWEGAVSGTAPRTRRGWPAQSLALLVTAVTMLAWVGLWAAVFFPLIMFNDADNGRFGHDIRTLWVPEVAPATATAIVLLVIAGIGRKRPLGRAALAGSALLVAATLTISAAAMALHHP